MPKRSEQNEGKWLNWKATAVTEHLTLTVEFTGNADRCWAWCISYRGTQNPSHEALSSDLVCGFAATEAEARDAAYRRARAIESTPGELVRLLETYLALEKAA